MKKVKWLLSLLLAVVMLLSACATQGGTANKEEKLKPGILLCGEGHSDQRCIDRELELWDEFYSKGARHLFLEDSYASSKLLNDWMKAEDDEIFDALFENSKGTQGYSQVMSDFFHNIKENYPETIFHGIDIEHQYKTTGEMYLEKLRNEGKEDSEEYKLCSENIEQAVEAYKISDISEFFAYREKYMISNFEREYEPLKDEFIMGIFGSAHTDPENLDDMQSGPTLAKKLKDTYGDLVQTEEMIWRDPIRVDKITIDGKEYDASYFGFDDEREWGDDCESWEIWRIEDAYDDFKNYRTNEDYAQYYYFPEKIELGRVYMFRVKYYGGTSYEYFYRSDADYMYYGTRCVVGFDVNSVEINTGEDESAEEISPEDLPERILLCGEKHSDDTSINKELELWKELYANGARHLFIEVSYAKAALFNIWMQEETDTILDQLWRDASGTPGNGQNSYDFFKAIKEKCPETIFHGTDVGHFYDTTGKRYLEILKSEGKEDSEEYRLAESNNEQGKLYYNMLAGKEYDPKADWYREQSMVENFVRECKGLRGEVIMGIYGRDHVYIGKAWYGADKSMATLLKERYGERLEIKDVAMRSYERIDKLVVAGKEYEAYYYGSVDISAWAPEYKYREFWMLKDAYNDFKNAELTGMVLPYNNYPMEIELYQVYVVKYTMADGTTRTTYNISNGNYYEGKLTTEEIKVGE